MLAANIISALAIGAIAGPAWGEFEMLAASPSPDIPAMQELLPKVLPAGAISRVVQLVAAAAVNASVLRALLRPERRATVRFGVDEVRVVGLLVAYIVVSMLATVALSIVLALVGVVAGQAAVALAPFASLAVMAVLFIRFSLAGPMTIAEHRFRFRPSWAATKGWFWPLLGSETLAAALALVVVILGYMIFTGLAGAAVLITGGALADLPRIFTPDFSTPDKLMALWPLVYVAFVSVLYALVLVLLVAPPVELYRLQRAEGETP
jgi:hypothetical protein